MALPSIFRAARFAAGILALAGLVSAQEPSVILKSLDQLEKRVSRVEAELGHLRKSGPAATASVRPDTAVAALAARLDSLGVRLGRLETAPVAKTATPVKPPDSAAKAVASSFAAAAPEKDSIAVLIREVRALTAALKAGSMAAAPATAAIAQAPAKSSAPSSLSPAAGSAVPAPAPAAALALKGDIQIQGERKFTAQSGRNNLDDFWGRLNFGAEYNGDDFQSKVNIRIFPEGFGFEPLTGASFDTTGQGSLKVQSQPSPRMVINHAWVRYTTGPAKVRLGRFETVETKSDNYGNYVDLGPSGGFMSRPAVHNAVEATAAAGPGNVSALLGASDTKLNHGFLRMYGRYPVAAGVEATLGYRANLFDRYHYPDAEILQRFDAGLSAALPSAWKAFMEAAVLQAAGRADDTPVLLGIQHPAGKVFDVVSLEGEWLNDRKAAGKDRPWLLNLHVRKSAGRLKVDAGAYSDPADPDWNAFKLGLRLTSTLR
ncbi:MAG: hypothetical protein JF616_13780 [Fibrobacteres bacterium]|nr:hypothetical protein [Fibrobacterota bacterium]